jgi:hypothetical protein
MQNAKCKIDTDYFGFRDSNTKSAAAILRGAPPHGTLISFDSLPVNAGGSLWLRTISSP